MSLTCTVPTVAYYNLTYNIKILCAYVIAFYL